MSYRMEITKNIRKLTLSLFLPIILLIAGCQVGPDFKTPEMATPETYRFSDEGTDELVNLKWWELFNDEVLGDLVRTALEQNRDIMTAISRIEEARAIVKFIGADRYPAVDIEGGARRGNFSASEIFDSDTDFAFISPVISWELDFWGKFRRATEAARAELIATEYAARTVQISLISEVVSTYFSLLDFHQRLIIAQRTLESREETLRIISKRFENGIVTELDLNQAQIQKEIAASAIPLNERLIALTENALSTLLGTYPREIPIGNELYSQVLPPDIPVGLPSTLLERRPDIKEALYRLQAQNARIGVAQAIRLPAFNITGNVGGAYGEQASVSSSDFIWSIGAFFFWPVINFGKNKARVDIETSRTEQARLEYENRVLNAVREVSDALKQIEKYNEQIKFLDKQTVAARNANHLSNLRYDKGVTSYLEVLETERQLFDVEVELSQTTQEYYNSYVGLYKALGGGWISKEAFQQFSSRPGELQ